MEQLSEFAQWIKRRFLPLKFDAAGHPAEMYYAQIYLEYLDRHMSELAPALDILDAGCGTGRFLIPLAERGHRLTGMDRHSDALRMIREKVHALGRDVTIVDGSLDTDMGRLGDATFDVVTCIEVLYTSRDREGVTRELLRVLKPGGLLFVTHRPRFFFLMQSLRNGSFDDAQLVSSQPAGRLRVGHHRVFYNWQALHEIREMYERLGVDLVALYPIGPYSGFGSDPLGVVCDAEKLDDGQRDLLKAIESARDDETLASSRYVLAVVRKPAGG